MREGTLRLVEIRDFDLSACGGTHVHRTGAIGDDRASPAPSAFAAARRLTFVCGARALRMLARLSRRRRRRRSRVVGVAARAAGGDRARAARSEGPPQDGESTAGDAGWARGCASARRGLSGRRASRRRAGARRLGCSGAEGDRQRALGAERRGCGAGVCRRSRRDRGRAFTERRDRCRHRRFERCSIVLAVGVGEGPTSRRALA